MKALRKPKIGLVGMMAHPFRGDKEGFFAGDAQDLHNLSNTWNCDLKIVPEGIYNMEDVGSAAKKLADWGADYVLVQSSSFAGGDFIRPFAELKAPLGLWGVPEGPPSPEGGLPLNSFTGMNLYNSLLRTFYAHSPGKVKWFFGRPSDPLFHDRFKVTVAALRAFVNLDGAHIGLVGGVAPGFDNLIVDPRHFTQQLGVRITALELDAVLATARNLKDDKQINQAAEIFIQPNVNLQAGMGSQLSQLARLQIAFESLIQEHGFDALAVSCWPRFQVEPGMAVCSLVGQLNSLNIITACEGDIPSALSMFLLKALTNEQVVTLMDLVTVDINDQTALLWHCGPTSPALADDKGVNMGSLWLFDGDQGEPKGLHNDMRLRPGPVTVMGIKPDLSGMLVLSGQIDNQKPAYKGSCGWLGQVKINNQPATIPQMIETLMQSGFQHHYPLAYGDLSEACLELAALLGINPLPLQPYTTYLKG